LSVGLVVVGAVWYWGQPPAPMVTEAPRSENNDPQNVALVNPASGFCIQSGGSREMITGVVGESADCVFLSGERCEEWALFRGECAITGLTNPGLFVATETYKGMNAGDKTVVFAHQDYTRYRLNIGDVVSGGQLNTQRGWQDDIDATVFVLNWQATDDEQILFVKKTDSDSLTQVNSNRTELVPAVKLKFSN